MPVVQTGYGAPVLMVMWAVLVGLGVVVVTWRIGVSRFAFLAMVHDSLPVTLVWAWVVAAYGVATQQWLLLGAAVPLLVVHLLVIVSRLAAAPTPEWVSSAAHVKVVVANVFIGNRTPQHSAVMLLQTEADLLVVAERSESFMREFGRAGGMDAYPFRVDGPSNEPDYATAIASRTSLLDGSSIVYSGSMRIVRAVLQCGSTELSIVAVHLRAVTEPGGFHAWRAEMRDLASYLTTVAHPFVVVGDFNSSQFRPALARLLRDAGLLDAHHTVGKGLTRSLKPAAHGALAWFPAFTRVDHALLSPGVHAVEVVNLPTAGSDHYPFLATLAVQQSMR